MADTDGIKRRLNQHRKKAMECEFIRKELEYIEEQYGNVKAVDYGGLPLGKGGGRSSPTERIVLRKIELENKLKSREVELEDDWREIESLMFFLEPTESLIIRLRYLYAVGWNEVCEKIYGKREDYAEEQESYKNRVFLMHGRALISLSKAEQKK